MILILDKVRVKDRFMVFNATFSNISVISWRSVLLVDEAGVPEEKPLTCKSIYYTITTTMDSILDNTSLQSFNQNWAKNFYYGKYSDIYK